MKAEKVEVETKDKMRQTGKQCDRFTPSNVSNHIHGSGLLC